MAYRSNIKRRRIVRPMRRLTYLARLPSDLRSLVLAFRGRRPTQQEIVNRLSAAMASRILSTRRNRPSGGYKRRF